MELKKEIIKFKNWMFERYGISIANNQVNEYLLAKYNITDKLTETQKRVLDEKNNENSGLHKHVVSGSACDKGICKEEGCTKPATKDYNGHGHFVCDYHHRTLNDHFDEEYD